MFVEQIEFSYRSLLFFLESSLDCISVDERGSGLSRSLFWFWLLGSWCSVLLAGVF